MDDITLWPARRQAEAIAKRLLSARELLDAQLARIEAVNPAINAVVTLDADRARAAAGEADEATARGDAVGPLHGLPITLKDAYEVAGWRSTGGSTQLADHEPAEDAPAVGRLRQAGVVLLGRTNVPEWSGDLQTYNEVFGVTNNPWDTARTPGGSSGGAGAAVATGMTSFELGTDIGGSIRVPSAFNGVCGHKPSWGVVPTTGYLDHAGVGRAERQVNVFGPLARSVDDLSLLLDVLGGPNPREAVAWRLELPAPRATEPGGLRVAAWLDDAACPIDPAVRDVLERAAAALAGAGATVSLDARPELDFAEAAWTGLATVGGEIAISTDDDSFAFLESLEGQPLPDAMAQLVGSVAQRHRTWLRGQEARHRHQAAWQELFADWDIVLCPVTITTAFPHDTEGTVADRTVTVGGTERSYLDLLLWTTMIGSAELPSTVVPVGFVDCLPVGIQVVGPYLEDRTSLAAAAMLEELLGGYTPPPIT
jgi:amidase